jgi:hypothetical protein
MQGRGGDPALRAALGAKSSAVFYVSSDTLMSPPLRPNGPLLSLAICPFFHGIRKDSPVATRATISPTNGVSQSTIQSCLPVRFLDLVLKFAPPCYVGFLMQMRNFVVNPMVTPKTQRENID